MRISNFNNFIIEKYGSNESVERMTSFFMTKLSNDLKKPSYEDEVGLIPAIFNEEEVFVIDFTMKYSYTKDELLKDNSLKRFGLSNDELFNTIEEWEFIFRIKVLEGLGTKFNKAALSTKVERDTETNMLSNVIDNEVTIILEVDLNNISEYNEKGLLDSIRYVLNHEFHHVLQRSKKS